MLAALMTQGSSTKAPVHWTMVVIHQEFIERAALECDRKKAHHICMNRIHMKLHYLVRGRDDGNGVSHLGTLAAELMWSHQCGVHREYAWEGCLGPLIAQAVDLAHALPLAPTARCDAQRCDTADNMN